MWCWLQRFDWLLLTQRDSLDMEKDFMNHFYRARKFFVFRIKNLFFYSEKSERYLIKHFISFTLNIKPHKHGSKAFILKISYFHQTRAKLILLSIWYCRWQIGVFSGFVIFRLQQRDLVNNNSPPTQHLWRNFEVLFILRQFSCKFVTSLVNKNINIERTRLVDVTFPRLFFTIFVNFIPSASWKISKKS